MADPFEVRMRFTSQLQHLNASITSSQKAAHYALRYKDMDEDLHSCILEQLERNSMNNRANIMYFIEHLCDMAQREHHLEYIRMIQRDILRVVDAVAPEDGSGAANVKVIRRVLKGLQNKSIFNAPTVTEIEGCLKERDTLPTNTVLSPIPANGHRQLSTSDVENNDSASFKDSTTTTTTAITTHGVSRKSTLVVSGGSGGGGGGTGTMTNGTGISPMVKLDKKQIEQRIEEDRERHKRLRESIWAVNADDDASAEFEKLWVEASDVAEDDHLAAEEDKLERRAVAQALLEEAR